MAIPVINNTTSIQSHVVGVPVNFQPFATNTPTSWAASALPAGLSINGTSGLISGTPTAAGVSIVGLTATNGEGTSAVQVVYFGIRFGGSGGSGLTLSAAALTIDTITKAVTLPGDELVIVSDTDFLAEVFFKRGDSPATLTVTDLELVIEKFEPDTALVVSTEYRSMNSGEYWQVYAPIEGTPLQAALADEENDIETMFTGRAQFRWNEAIAGWSGGPTSMRQKSQAFPVKLTRALS